jgi:hypothetical protein
MVERGRGASVPLWIPRASLSQFFGPGLKHRFPERLARPDSGLGDRWQMPFRPFAREGIRASAVAQINPAVLPNQLAISSPNIQPSGRSPGTSRCDERLALCDTNRFCVKRMTCLATRATASRIFQAPSGRWHSRGFIGTLLSDSWRPAERFPVDSTQTGGSRSLFRPLP